MLAELHRAQRRRDPPSYASQRWTRFFKLFRIFGGLQQSGLRANNKNEKIAQ